MKPYEYFRSSRINRYLGLHEERTCMPAVPTSPEKLLSGNQVESFDALNGMGWKLKFVRRERRRYPLFVFENKGTNCFASIEKNGDITINPDINFRN